MHYPSESVQKSAGYFHDLKEANYGVPAVSEPHRCWVLLKTPRPDWLRLLTDGGANLAYGGVKSARAAASGGATR